MRRTAAAAASAASTWAQDAQDALTLGSSSPVQAAKHFFGSVGMERRTVVAPIDLEAPSSPTSPPGQTHKEKVDTLPPNRRHKRTCRIGILRVYPRPWYHLALYLLYITAFSIWWVVDGEDVVWMYGGNPYSSAELYELYVARPHYEVGRAMDRTSPALHRVDTVMVSHYAKFTERLAKLQHRLAKAGIHDFHVSSFYNRSDVLKPDVLALASRRYFTKAVDLPSGKALVGVTHKYTLMWSPEARTETKYVPVDSQFLARYTNAMEHLHMWQQMLEDPTATAALILEDDVVPVQNFKRRFTHYMRQVPEDFDIVYVGTCQGRHAERWFATTPSTRISTNIYHVREHRCANAYIISRAAVERLFSAEADAARWDQFVNIDPWIETHFDTLLPRVYWFEPPLSYESSKMLLAESGSSAGHGGRGGTAGGAITGPVVLLSRVVSAGVLPCILGSMLFVLMHYGWWTYAHASVQSWGQEGWRMARTQYVRLVT